GLARPVERVEAGQDRRDVRRHAGAARGQAVLLARAWSSRRRPTRRMLVPTGRRIEGIEAVAEDARRVVRNEGVLAPPAGAVDGVERVEIDEDAEAVGGRSEPRRAEAVDGLPLIGDPAEEAF